MAYKDAQTARDRSLEYYYRNREQILVKRKAHYAANRERIGEKTAAYRKANPEVSRRSNRKFRGVLEPHGERPDGPCEICTETGALYLDHDHTTGRIRGWLCTRCNQGLGFFKDTPERLRRAAVYLEEKSK